MSFEILKKKFLIITGPYVTIFFNYVKIVTSHLALLSCFFWYYSHVFFIHLMNIIQEKIKCVLKYSYYQNIDTSCLTFSDTL